MTILDGFEKLEKIFYEFVNRENNVIIIYQTRRRNVNLSICRSFQKSQLLHALNIGGQQFVYLKSNRILYAGSGYPTVNRQYLSFPALNWIASSTHDSWNWQLACVGTYVSAPTQLVKASLRITTFPDFRFASNKLVQLTKAGHVEH